VRASHLDEFVVRFVAAVNTGYRERVAVEIHDVPPSVLVGGPDEYGEYEWAIRPRAAVDWVDAMEERQSWLTARERGRVTAGGVLLRATRTEPGLTFGGDGCARRDLRPGPPGGRPRRPPP
jgi:hypothetical protein